nr:hypothetical protein [Veillonella denticariosi]
MQFIFLFIMGKWVYYGVFRCPYIVPFVNCESCSMITCWGANYSVFLCMVDYHPDYGSPLWPCFLQLVLSKWMGKSNAGGETFNKQMEKSKVLYALIPAGGDGDYGCIRRYRIFQIRQSPPHYDTDTDE